MMALIITLGAEAALELIFAHDIERWGRDQARRYSDAIIDMFDRIAGRTQMWRPIPAEAGVEGFRCRCARHYIYWRSSDACVTIVAILHERMDYAAKLRDGD